MVGRLQWIYQRDGEPIGLDQVPSKIRVISEEPLGAW